MGLISKLKSLFNKNIECGFEADSHIVFPLKKKKYLYIKKNIVVRDGFSCVIVVKGKATEVLNPGKYKINSENLPETFERAKKKKSGNLKKIRAKIYFVNKREFRDFYFCSDEPFVAKSPETGKIKGFLQGTCAINVIDSMQLMKTIINHMPKADEKGIANYLSLNVGNGINKKVKKLKIPAGELLSNAQSLEGLINREIEDSYDNLGVFVKNVKLKGVNFPKRYKKRVGEYMARHGRVVKPQYIQTQRAELRSQNDERVSGLKEQVLVEKQSVKIENAYVPPQKSVPEPPKKTTICNRCGAQNDEGSKICKYCGNNLINN